MSQKSDREAFRNLLVDLFAIRTAEGLGELKLLSRTALTKFRDIAGPKADEVLRNYEKGLMVEEISAGVIEKLSTDLRARTRLGKLIEIALNVSLLVMGALIGLSQFIFDPVANKSQITAVYFALLIIVASQLAGNLYLRYFDNRS
jgi:hypothetical protein